MIYCFNDNKPFVCASGYYLDINSYTCNQYCPPGFIRPPDEIAFNDRDYCNVNCNSSSVNCPNTSITYKNIKDNFVCLNNFLTIYYNCVSSTDPIIQKSIYYLIKLHYISLIF